MGVQRYDFLINFQIFPALFCNFFAEKSRLQAQEIDFQGDLQTLKNCKQIIAKLQCT
jgi:hypothetical protein